MRTINNRRTARLLTASALAIGLVAIAQPALAGIANTRHNLGNTASGGNNSTTGTQELCVFCHTPHGSDGAAAAPLWNKYINPATTYQMYGTTNSATFEANTSPTLPGGVSLACLTCHDGTQAMDNMLNAPGAGAFNSTGGGAGGLAYTWAAGTGAQVSATGVLTNTATRQPMLGTDLRNDHPVGMNYCASTSNTEILGADCQGTGADPDFNSGSSAGTRRYIETGGNTTFSKTDLPLYTDGGSITIKVECATCHDPHTAAVPLFLRTTNAGSALCLACHIK